MTAATPFDALATDYDATFTRSVIGTLLRRAVWRRLDVAFRSGDRVLELNCGTGEDAVYLARRGVRVLATDASRAMVERAARKAAQQGVRSLVETAVLDVEQLETIVDRTDLRANGRPFDGALSNFGGLNCVADLRVVARGLARLVRPDGRVILCVMGPLVPWEWVWFLLRGRPGIAFRRLRPSGLSWRGVPVRYPSPRRLRRAFAGSFRIERQSALGALLPPPYAESWAVTGRRMLERLDRWERRFETVPPLVWLADHYLIELERC